MRHCFLWNDRYTPNELRYLPLNTALYEPPLDPDLPALDSEPDSDDAEDGKDTKKNKNSSVRYKFGSNHLFLFLVRCWRVRLIFHIMPPSPSCFSTGEFFWKCIWLGEPGGRRWARSKVQGQRRQPPVCLPQSSRRLQGRGQNHLNSSPTTAAVLYSPSYCFYYYSLHFATHPPLPTFFTFSDFLRVVGSLAAATLQTDGMSGQSHTFFFLFFVRFLCGSLHPPCTWLSNKNILKEQLTCFCFPHFAFLGFRRVKNKDFFPLSFGMS